MAHKDGNFQVFTKKDGLAGDYAVDICQARAGSLLLAVLGVNRRTGDKFEALAKLDGAKRLLEDREGNVWVGGNNTGLRQYGNPQTTSPSQPERQPRATFCRSCLAFLAAFEIVRVRTVRPRRGHHNFSHRRRIHGITGDSQTPPFDSGGVLFSQISANGTGR